MIIHFRENANGEKNFRIQYAELFWKRKIVAVLEEIEGLQIIRKPKPFNGFEFCTFKLDGCEFRVREDDGFTDGLCTIYSAEASVSTWNKIIGQFENFIEKLPKPKPPRPTSKPLVALLTILLFLTILFWLSNTGM